MIHIDSFERICRFGLSCILGLETPPIPGKYSIGWDSFNFPRHKTLEHWNATVSFSAENNPLNSILEFRKQADADDDEENAKEEEVEGEQKKNLFCII